MRATLNKNQELTLHDLSPVQHAMLIKFMEDQPVCHGTVSKFPTEYFEIVTALRNPEKSPTD